MSRAGLALAAWLCLGSFALAQAPASPGSSAPAKAPPAAPAAEELLGLADAAAVLKARLEWDPLTRSGALLRAGARLDFALDSPWAYFQSVEALPFGPLRESGGRLLLARSSLPAAESRFAALEAARKSHFTVAAVILDPGHGGKDPGAIGEHLVGGKKFRVLEKDIALDVAKRVESLLQARFPELRVLMTRTGDSYPSLDDRVETANQVELAAHEAVIYISIHANASFNKNARGFEVWYLNPEYRRTLVDQERAAEVGKDIAPILNAMLEEEFTTESIILARNILEGMAARIGAESPNRGVRAEEWFVVRNAKMPSILVELGFVTHPEEAKLLADPEYLRKSADGIYSGVVEFIRYFENMEGPAAP